MVSIDPRLKGLSPAPRACGQNIDRFLGLAAPGFMLSPASQVAEKDVMKKTNFDRYLKQQMKDPAFATRFEQAGEAWDVSIQLAALRQQAGLSQKELARRLQNLAATH